VVRDAERRMGPYAFHGNQWVSYDDVATIRMKVRTEGEAERMCSVTISDKFAFVYIASYNHFAPLCALTHKITQELLNGCS